MVEPFSDDKIKTKTSSFTLFEKNEVWEYRKYGIYYTRKPEIDFPDDMTVEFFTDQLGYYFVVIGDHILYRYEILGVLGRGSFGVVLKVFDHKDNRISAMKIERTGIYLSLHREYLFVKALERRFPDKGDNILQIYSYMSFRNHPFLVQEMLGSDLEKTILAHWNGLPPNIVKDLIYSTLKSLCLFYDVGLIHADVKPGNIVLSQIDTNQVKIIDFGCSHKYVENITAGYIQTRTYRAPEVLLRAVYGTPIDMWSLGCVTAELLLGQPLFFGYDEVDQFCRIIEVLGLPPKTIIENTRISQEILNSDDTLNMPIYHRYVEKDLPGSRNLEKLFGVIGSPNWIDFMAKCLTWNPNDRITPHEAMEHCVFQSTTQ